MSWLDREHVKKVFANYTAAYDVTDERIKLKIDHTYRVAELCRQIAESLHLSSEEVELAWLLGMLHDVGRFEQLRRYGTFIDADSIDHAQFGADILFVDGRISDYLPELFWEGNVRDSEPVNEHASDKLRVIETAIRQHSAFRISENLDESTERFCHILRDADKIDILKVNVDVPFEAIYSVTTEELKNCTVSEAVLDSFREEHATLRSMKKTPVDNLAGHISLVYELVFPLSVQLVKEQGYLEGLLHFESDNPKTNEQFSWIRERIAEYMERRNGEMSQNL